MNDVFGGRRRKPDPARVAEFAATARKLHQEREASAALVDRLLRETPRGQWPQLAERDELRTSGALEQLSAEFAKRLNREPREALAISEITTAITDTLPDDAYPRVVVAQLRAHAWKERGAALGALSRHAEALDAFDRAEQVLAPFGTLAHDRAVVRLVHASTLQDVQRFEESLALLRECTGVFADHGDYRRHLVCGIAQGVLMQRLGRFREARATYLALIDVANTSGDRHCVASLHNNIGHASTELGDFDAADAHLSRAVALLGELGEPLGVARAELARGRLMIRRGQIDRGIAHLRTIRDQFLRHTLVEEAGLCALEMVEAFLATGSSHEAERLARTVIGEFTAARLNARAITALGYLSEAIAARKASPQTIAQVREYIDSLHREPDRPFAYA
ncbi:MAG TPA: tetratricopeptide repeat protein [Thermoanaerobaculia bacterium]|nr:tetratricopeptide repeat protein [Thermoanaerobaculia bacterium]